MNNPVRQTLETENSYYMVMELCAGGDLMDRICERKRLEEREVRRYTRQILSAVEHLHKHGIVHRSLHTHARTHTQAEHVCLRGRSHLQF